MHTLKRKSFCELLSAFFFIFWLMSLSLANANNTSANNNIPEDLKQWVPWVLKDNPQTQCPVTYNRSLHFCAYPDTLSIDLKDRSGSFEQKWNVYAKSWISLPGDNKTWPENVRVNNKYEPVVLHNNKPSVQLLKGRYSITGKFSWQQRPKSVSIPQETGLIHLSINNKSVQLPDFREGKLWLKTVNEKTHQNNRLDLQVFRKITDSIPLRVTTHIRLDVSGQQREVILGGALLSGFTPGEINSQLPSQIDKDGRLKIQLRPGQWVVDISAFNQQLLNEISLAEFKSPWPENEIWVLEQKPQLRLIKVIDKNSIDPNQTQLPQHWKSYPAYNLQANEQLKFDTLKRGNPEPEPDQLSLNKKLWLDFDGEGFTVNDKITGKLSRQWRLNASDLETGKMKLGQVTLNGKPQFITENEKAQQGVEVRHGNLDLSADSRIEGSARNLSASGWDMDFNKVNATLYLPAGWKLMSISGANAHNTWIKQWSLLDLFMVLITAIAIYRAFGHKWGAVALITLTLVWHESGSPQYIWINLVVAIALLRVLPEGRFIKVIRSYRLITSIFLVIIILPFMVDQIRSALYPQLEFGNISADENYYRSNASFSSPVESLSDSINMAEEDIDLRERKLSRSQGLAQSKVRKFSASSPARYKAKQVASIDPDAMIQTGPGLPSWTLHEYQLYWDGPVQKDQALSMILLSPAMNALFKVLQIAFILLLAWRLLDVSSLKMPKSPRTINTPGKSNSNAAAISKVVLGVFLTGSLLGLMPAQVEAAFPSENLLKDLQEELTKPAECLPNCASIQSMSIAITPGQLTINLRIHTQEDVLLPLPVPVKQWMPEKIRIDGKHTSGLIRKEEASLWLHSVKGTHDVSISGRLTNLNQLQFSFPLKPHYISLSTQGWLAEGMEKQAHKITALTLLRIIDKNKSAAYKGAARSAGENQAELPVFAQVTRSLELGMDWYINTYVQGISGSAYPVILNIPLLKGESVVTENIKVKDNHAVITLNSSETIVSWASRLETSNKIRIKADEQGLFIEKWALNVSPIWHVKYQGTPVIYHQRQGNRWRPEWQPWPGESISLDVSRPKGVKGKTLTIDSSTLLLTPGEQITAAKLVFNLRSSLGGQHAIDLPVGADLQTVSINGQSMPIRNTQEGLSLPVSPGNQKIEIQWREPHGISSVFKSSEFNLGLESVNNVIKIEPGYNRWVLFTSGPSIGPAVLFWGMLIVIIIISYGLGRIKDTPLNSLQWVLLGMGLSASGPWGLVVIATCIFALRARGKMNTEHLSTAVFNFMQLGLVMLVFFSVSTLLVIIQQGLLGSPDMQITGNGSSAYLLNWFSDRIDETVPKATIISVPVYIYRLMMLAWSIWLAFALIKWAKWSWFKYTTNEYWRNTSIISKEKKSDNKESDSNEKL